ncbi:pleckstrin homology domain-containing family H member 2-like [Hydractinia symbiolongicarpus]|uniref:pleckstrin homology domain-containing family H member 2-like n=1 Tax=Hydractinia symbiolongicarpus TaxID=13093 RepID=UPI00254CA879|nr:pleckstrin homology domain-containing family H member 2-like [Hydractinia symbiolongicarpus]
MEVHEDKMNQMDTGTEDVNSHLTWKEKYELADRQLTKFRRQAGKVRELLSQKMTEYEARVTAAEQKRDETLERLEKLEIACQDKDEAINALREKIARLREERNNFMLLDEEKMGKIKEWVQVKFTELFRELEKVKVERDELQKKCDRESKRASDFSFGSHASHYYEEVFGELLDDLKEQQASYESISSYLIKKQGSGSSTSSGAHAKPKTEPPVIPPRRASIREESRFLNSSKSKPTTSFRPSSPSFLKQMFDLKEEGAGSSMQSLNEEVLKMSLDEETSASLLGGNYKEPMSPIYFTLQEMANGGEFNKRDSVPVFSLLEGKASQIRKQPFTGDTSDSEIDADQDQRTANNLPIRKVIATERSVKEKPARSADSSPEPQRPQLRTCASFTEQNMREETLAKAGWLTKLGGRVKNWKKRWFTLIDGKLSYFKARGDMYRKPLGWIDIKQVTQLTRSEQPLTFEVTTPERIYYLTADSKEEIDDWMRVLRNALRRFGGARLMSRAGEKTVFSGWVTKAKCGISKHCWAVLKEKSILFYKNEFEQGPIGAISLREIISVSPVEKEIAQSDAENVDTDGTCRLMIQCLKDSHPTYFVVSSRSDMELWLHQLQQMCSGNDENNETDFETLVTKLMNIDGDPGSRYWRNKMMIHSKQLLKESLTSLRTTELEKEAINLWKSIQLFSNTPINETAIDYHISLSQDIVQVCLTYPELQTEIYCQLIKQTSKYRSKPNTAGSNYMMSNDWVADPRQSQLGTIDQQPVSAFVYMQCWQLIALCTSIFLPKLKILWLLKAHLHRNASESSDVGRYAIYCQRSLERTLKNGERETKPSRIEALSLIARNPYFRIYPMSIPVYFINNSYQLFSFDGSTTVTEFISRINEEVGIRDNSESGYSLFTDNPVASIEHCLQGDLKLCDVISKWEQASQQLKTGRVERSKAIKLTYKNRLFFKSLMRSQTEKEKLLHVFQINDNLRSGHLLSTRHVLSKLTALLAQIELGDYVDHFKYLEDIIQKIYPKYNFVEEAAMKKKIFKDVADAWSSLKGRLLKDCVHSYISIAQTIPFYGCKLFKAQEKFHQQTDEKENVWLAIEEEKIQILKKNMDLLKVYAWQNVVTFGGFQEDFMLVVQPDESAPEKTERHLFAMPPGRVLEVTLLIASYINAVVTRCGINLDVKSSSSLSPLPTETSNNNAATSSALKLEYVHLWDMETEK